MTLDTMAYPVRVNSPLPLDLCRPPGTAKMQAATTSRHSTETFVEFLQQACESSRQATVHVVEKGENLSYIVRDHLKSQGITPSNARIYRGVAQVARANKLANPDLIYPGQQIDLTAIAPMQAAASAKAQFQEPASMVPWPTSSVHLLSPLRLSTASSRPSPSPPHTVAPARQPMMADSAVKAHAVLPGEDTGRTFQGGRHSMIEVTERLRRLSTPPSDTVAKASCTEKQAWTPETEPMGGAAPASSDRASITDLVRAILTPKTSALPKAQSPWRPMLEGSARLTSGFGMRKDPFTGRPEFHEGIDLAAKTGAKIHPFRPGTVTFSGWQTGYGKVVVVEHEDGAESVYGHNAQNLAPVGAKVDTSSVLGLVGSTGRSTGPHLHFEIRENGHAVNPIRYLVPGNTRVAKRF